MEEGQKSVPIYPLDSFFSNNSHYIEKLRKLNEFVEDRATEQNGIYCGDDHMDKVYFDRDDKEIEDPRRSSRRVAYYRYWGKYPAAESKNGLTFGQTSLGKFGGLRTRSRVPIPPKVDPQ